MSPVFNCSYFWGRTEGPLFLAGHPLTRLRGTENEKINRTWILGQSNSEGRKMSSKAKNWFITGLTVIGLLLASIASSYAQTVTYAYDGLNRLIGAQYANGTIIQYSYDCAGNRLGTNTTSLYANFTGNGIWQWNGTTWSQDTPNNPTSMVASYGILYANYGSAGLWKYDVPYGPRSLQLHRIAW